MPVQSFNLAANPAAEKRRQGEELLAVIAQQKPDMDDILFLINNGASLAETDRDGNSALMNIVSWGNRRLIETMLEKGADINHRNHRGDTALHRLATGGGPTATFLVEKGADALLANNAGKTPYDIAKAWAQNPLLPVLEPQVQAARAMRATSIDKKLTVSKPFRPLKPLRFRKDAPKS